MFNDLNFGLKQRFEIKSGIDLFTFIAIFSILVFLVLKYEIPIKESLIYILPILLILLPLHFITKRWLEVTIKREYTLQSETLDKMTKEINETINSQKQILEDIYNNSQNVSSLIEKLRDLSADIIMTSKNTEKQVGQSITYSSKEHDAIANNSDKMLNLRQKIQMVAELILELSEHTQQIGSTISVVDDIAEQTNMLALNAAVEAARAGEHGKGFAVVAGEIRKLADESKQAITKITSLTTNIQYTTNSTVMATEEGSKEIETVVKDTNFISSNSEALHGLIENILESLNVLSQKAEKQNEIIERLNTIDIQNKNISANFEKIIKNNSEKIAKLNNLSNEIKSSVMEG